VDGAPVCAIGSTKYLDATTGELVEQIRASTYYDEDYGEYVCDIDMDEDEYIRFLSDRHTQCPYYRNGDEYLVVRSQM
jgi:hypothetical protein